MSAKWRALQHRHQYTYTAVIFPESYIDRLHSLSLEYSSLNFFSELKELISLNSIYAQVNAVKKLASAFGELVSNCDETLVSEASRFYLEILFIENSLPLHRTLVSVLAKSRNSQSVIASCFRSLCDEYGFLGSKGRRFLLCRVALSMMSFPKLGFLVEIVNDCSISVALDAAFGLKAVSVEVNNGARPSPVAMEQCQEALSCIYYLLQRFPSKFTNSKEFPGSTTLKDSTISEVIMDAIINILKSSSFSRDSLVAAGVGFCAALQLYLTPEELGYFIVENFYPHTNLNVIHRINGEFGKLELKVPYKGDLYLDIGNFSVLSRICVLRGILTSVPRAVLNFHFDVSGKDKNYMGVDGSCSNGIWTILFDGILPELCNYCENPVDSHFNFHVLTVMQICFQQIKTLVSTNLLKLSKNYNPLPEEMGSRILRIIWNNLEDPLNQTVKQVHLIFALFLDVQTALSSSEDVERTKSFLQKTTIDLLRLGPRCKGRYVPLAYLTKKLGAMTVLNMCPDLLFETIYAYVDDDVCCAATTFLKCLLECLRDECWNCDGVDRGYMTFRGYCLPPIMYGLVSGVPKLRSNLNTYALSVVLEVDVDSIFPMLDSISVGQNSDNTELSCPELTAVSKGLSVDQQVAALVSLLKVSRSLALIEGDIEYNDFSIFQKIDTGTENSDLFALLCMKGIKVKVLVKWLILALTHVDETLRVDAAESLFLNPKTSSLPSHLELSLLKEAVPLNMRCCSTAFQMKWSSLFRKFFARVRTALERQFKQGPWTSLICSESSKVASTDEILAHRANNLFKFMRWFSCFLFFSCYPSAPYERKIMAMELILIMINVWPVVHPPKSNCSSTPLSVLYPYNEGFTLPDSTLLLVGSIIDSWDRLRENSFRILLHFPNPLPGISSEDGVREVITWAKKLICSPRVRESDAGALSLRLIFRKYVLDLGWIVGASVNVVCFRSESDLPNCVTQISKSRFPVIEYILSLIDWLDVAVTEGESDLSEACRNSFVHGVLLTLRYTFEELDWSSDVVYSSNSEMRNALEKLLELVKRITSLALWVVSADAWHLPEDIDDMVNEDVFLPDIPAEMTVPGSLSELQITNSKPIDTGVRPSEQVVMVGCWLAMKEVSLLLGTITRKVPLPTCTTSEGSDTLQTTISNEILDLEQLESIGNHFLEVLLKMKHNGAIDKTRAGFTALCNRLLCSNDPRLCKMTESWMEQLMERTVAKGQTVDDLLRRSAGIPAGFIALFLSEPDGTPKKLLPRALRWLIDVANTSLSNPVEANYQNADSDENLSIKLNQTPVSTNPTEMQRSENNSKVRDEGVIPTVHAFNVLRAAFNDTNLATDTSGFCAEALIISIRSFSSPYWEVRNSACLAYTALVRRMVGFLNVQKRESSRRALTAVEFFHRYPTLHPFLFHELEIATDLLGDGSSRHLKSDISRVVHPSLCPVLILLSRLKPSMISCETKDPLDPFLFMPFMRRCSTQSNLRIRVLASRALLGLVSNEKLPNVLLNIASELPNMRNQRTDIVSSGSSDASNEKHTSFNSIHGMLLQLCLLVDVNCRNLVDVSKKEQILGDFIQVLKMCSWLGSPKLCPCSVLNTSFLQLLDHILGILRTCKISRHIDVIRSLLLDSSSECLDADVSPKCAFYDPTKAELRRQAAVSYFNCVFRANTEAADEGYLMLQRQSPISNPLRASETEKEIDGFPNRLIVSISDASYEVRLATLKWLLRFLKSTGANGISAQSSSGIYSIYQWAETNLQSTLVQLLGKEENPRCTCYILRIIFTWNLLQFQKPNNQPSVETLYVGGMDCESILQLWDQLMSLSNVVRHTKTKEALLCCMGVCVKRFADLFKSSILLDKGSNSIINSSELEQSEKWSHIYGCICSFVNLIKEHSASSEPVTMRKAATDAIVASGLLGEASHVSSFVSNTQVPSEDRCSFRPSEAANLYACRILDLWFTCITLLEDEDVGVRERLAEDVQKSFTLNGSQRNHLGVVPTQVEKIIEMSFEFLSSVFGHWLMYFDYLARCVLNSATYMVAQGDLVRRVFDKEIDNHHEEKLLICQICCLHLEKLPVSTSWGASLPTDEVIAFLEKWRSRFYHQLISFANDYLRAEVGVNWIGGPGNHKDVFISLYANLLGLYALSRCIFNRFPNTCKSQLSDLVELEGIIRPFLRNPLISNLYLVVVQISETANSVDPKSSGESGIWEGFDPYFLLR